MSSPLLLGVRHHGPGSARAVVRALDAYRPEVVLVEGPPEADALVGFARQEDMRPPVALLAYPADLAKGAGRRASFWPFADFSPEWQAVRWAGRFGVPVRFCDLPAAYGFGSAEIERDGRDPLGELASAAGYDDPERWWEDVVEHRTHDAFGAIAEAMTELRGDKPAPESEERREAYMRTVLRAASKEYERVAVVCGAWHVPALTAPLPPASHDARTLRGLPKTKVTLTWVPWTHGRLASWQGYGAGVSSPGWYHHLFTVPDRVITRWMVVVARVLRDEGLAVSSAHVIEAVRLAEALAALRGRPLAGLAEVTEATRAVLCDGDEMRMALVARKVVVGERLGEVPEDVPAAPLARDVVAAQRRLRLPPSAVARELDLDLRRAIDLDRSRLLHRLRLLDVHWGVPGEPRRGKGTFWESWQLEWQPEFAVDLVAASGYGTSVAEAASAVARSRAAAASGLSDVTVLVERCLLADLPDAFGAVLRALDERAALDTDVVHLMAALPGLARTLRYGDVRGTDLGSLRAVIAGLVVRVCVGLPSAATGLDDDAAREMRGHVDGVHSALSLVDAAAALRDRWLDVLARLADRDDLAGPLGGRFTRLLLDAGRLDHGEVARRMGLVLTVGVPPATAAGWIEGFLDGGGLLLVHDERLLRLVDGWLAGIPDDMFVSVLPLLRRTFSQFTEPERRSIGERVRALASGAPASGRAAGEDEPDPERVAMVLPTVRSLLGRS